jgi:hypothetical protein
MEYTPLAAAGSDSWIVWQVASEPHRPAAQTPDGHDVPQAPQWEALVWVFTSQPLAGLPSQSAKPALQATSQVDDAQVAVALAPPGHARPHTPQCETLARTSTSQPLAAVPSQSPKPAAQRRAHAPAEHTPVALGPPAQARPQAPQLPASVPRNTSHPLAGLVSQSAKPASQVNPQRPAAQVRAALATAGQALPHAPQSVTSLWRLAHAAPQRVSAAAQPDEQA